MADQVKIQSEDDIYLALGLVRHVMKRMIFSDVEQQMVLVSVSELTRNILDHAGGHGMFRCVRVSKGLQVVVIDKGPGIDHIEQILNGHLSSSKYGLGLGLAGVNRMMDELKIETSSGGTTVIATKWERRHR